MGDNLPAGVINLTAGRNNNRVPPAAPRPPANARVPPAPPPAPGQMAQMQPPPPPPPPGHQQPQMQQMQQMHPVFQQPPVHMIPEHFRQRRLVERSDIRRERLTEADAREELSDYVIYRFEKLIDENEVDEEGYPTLPTWENVIRTEVRDMNKQAATRQIRVLERTTKSVGEKKASLIPAQQRQLEVALEELTRAEDDPRYCYALVQIDHQLKKLERPAYATYQTYYSGKKKDSKKVTVGRRRSTSSRSKERKKTKYERISLTAYYKRMPRPEENASQMLVQRERMMHMRLFPQPQPVMVHQMPPQPVIVQPQPQKGSGGGKGGGHVAIDVVNKNGKKQEIKIIRDSSPRSSRSSSSDGYSYGSTEYTPNSSIDSASIDKRHHRGRSRSRHRPHERPEYYGMEAPRRHSRHEQHYIMDSFPPPAPAPPSPLPLPPHEIEDAFHAGRIQGVRDAIRDTERILETRPRSVLPPRIINGRPPVRALPAYEVAQLRFEDDLDRFERLQIDTERRYEQDLELAAEIREEELRRRMALEGRQRRQRLADDAIALEEEQMWAEDRAKDYIRRNERFDAPNPFRPIGARARRHSYSYYD